MPHMDVGVVLATVVIFALILATGAGFVAARVLTHAADQGSGGDRHDP